MRYYKCTQAKLDAWNEARWPRHHGLVMDLRSFEGIITARVRSTREGNVLTPVCVSVHTCGGGYPIPGLVGEGTPSQVWLGGTPSQVWLGGYPIPGLDGVPPRPGTGYPPLQLGQGTPQTWDVVPPRTWDRVPSPRPGTGSPPRHEMGYPPRPGMGYPPDLGWGTPTQHSEHLLRGGRNASCVHAGGLSCVLWCIWILMTHFWASCVAHKRNMWGNQDLSPAPPPILDPLVCFLLKQMLQKIAFYQSKLNVISVRQIFHKSEDRMILFQYLERLFHTWQIKILHQLIYNW